ncbi:hypothetical protein [Corynebacterium efficiens YS-314]|uniref:Uncharacterized protein n=1 Tax=Corynebacterium efficiens (strain DSM 44549 / YS-314 / AJ 12310 / JCM 11189 / NBRC 100395) TaxID=196164 RepID=Q8FQ59_COREF|nr:hypothetical protein [Corynebacterium efficiens YS-314]
MGARVLHVFGRRLIRRQDEAAHTAAEAFHGFLIIGVQVLQRPGLLRGEHLEQGADGLGTVQLIEIAVIERQHGQGEGGCVDEGHHHRGGTVLEVFQGVGAHIGEECCGGGRDHGGLGAQAVSGDEVFADPLLVECLQVDSGGQKAELGGALLCCTAKSHDKPSKIQVADVGNLLLGGPVSLNRFSSRTSETKSTSQGVKCTTP